MTVPLGAIRNGSGTRIDEPAPGAQHAKNFFLTVTFPKSITRGKTKISLQDLSGAQFFSC
jgi:hypothetical protein